MFSKDNFKISVFIRCEILHKNFEILEKLYYKYNSDPIIIRDWLGILNVSAILYEN